MENTKIKKNSRQELGSDGAVLNATVGLPAQEETQNTYISEEALNAEEGFTRGEDAVPEVPRAVQEVPLDANFPLHIEQA